MTKTNALAAIEKLNVALAVALTATAGLVWGAKGALAAGVGGLIACVNLWAIRRLASRAIALVANSGDAPNAALLGFGIFAKMTLLFGLVWLAVGKGGLAVTPFALGISSIVISVLAGGLWIGMKGDTA